MAKRLIVCFDGTWNSPDQGRHPTNVVKIMGAIAPADAQGTPQIVFYDAGIGADGGRVDRVIDGVIGRGLDQNVRDGYRFLAHNWLQGDEIYVFGFSRGAFTARSLCGFISACGLLPGTAMNGGLRVAWEFYRKPKAEREQDREYQQLMRRSRAKVPVKCLGVWDTVGALGVPGELLQGFNHEYRFHNAEPCVPVEHAFHALAIDEKRGSFGPTMWQKKRGEALEGQKTVEQVWFPGVHSNVGGSLENAKLSDLALEWMIERVRAVSGLTFDDAYLMRNVCGDPMGEIYESRSTWYADARAYPYQRLIGQNEVDGSFLRRFKRFERRNRPDDGCEFVNEMIHWSAVERFGKVAMENGGMRRYEPPNLAAALDKGNVPIVQRQPGATALAAE